MADVALLILTLAWGTTFLLVKNALAGTSAGVFLLLRFAVATAAIAPVVALRRDPATPGVLRHGLLLGLAMFVGFALQTIGLRFTTPARSGFLTGLAVLIVPFLARFLLRRRVQPAAWMGVALALAGLLALTRPFGDGVAAEVRAGDVVTVGCAFAYAFQIIYTSEWSPRHPLALLTLVQVGTTLGLSALFLPFEPGAAALFSHLVGGEPLVALDWAGGALIVLGVAVGEVGGALGARRRAISPSAQGGT